MRNDVDKFEVINHIGADVLHSALRACRTWNMVSITLQVTILIVFHCYATEDVIRIICMDKSL